MKKATIFSAICVIAMAMTVFSCKEKTPDKTEKLLGSWSRTGQHIDIKASNASTQSLINTVLPILETQIQIFKTITFEKDGKGTYTDANNVVKNFTYVDNDPSVTVTAEDFKLGDFINLSGVPFTMTYSVNGNKLHFDWDATAMVKLAVGELAQGIINPNDITSATLTADYIKQ
jgi:hypothetical protein